MTKRWLTKWSGRVRYIFRDSSGDCRSSRWYVLFIIGVLLKNFANFTRKHLCWSLFLTKLQLHFKETPTQVFSWEICKNFKNTFFLQQTYGHCFCDWLMGSGDFIVPLLRGNCRELLWKAVVLEIINNRKFHKI